MLRQCALVTVMAVIICAGGGLLGQDEKSATPKGKQTLPKYWSKLGLSNDQKQKGFAVQADYGTKIDALQQQVKTLQKQERVEVEKILTADQRKQLSELVAGKPLIDPAGKNEKK